MKPTKFFLGLFISIILLYWAVAPLFGIGYFPMHDDTQVARVITLGNALKQGQFPVRIVDDLGYGLGYPIFNYYSPLPYYVGGILYALGVDEYAATKAMFLLGFMIAAITAFILFSSEYGVLPGILGSVMFSYAPYHAVQLYVRGSVGEYWAIAFVPLFVLGIRSLSKPHTYMPIVAGSVGLAAIITSHSILGVLTLSLFGLLYTSWSIISFIKNRKEWDSYTIIRAFLLVLFGMGLSAFFWLPAFLEIPSTSVALMIQSAPSVFYDHFLCVSQLWNAPWGFGGSAVGCLNDGMSFKLGKVPIILGLLSLGMYAYVQYKTHSKKNQIYLLALITLVITIFGMLSLSETVWRVLPFTSFIQYPWRLLSIAMLSLAAMVAYIPSVFHGRLLRSIVTLLLVTLVIITNTKNFKPNYTYTPDKSTLNTSVDLRYRVSKISDEYLPAEIEKPINIQEVSTSLFSPSEKTQIDIKEQTSVYASATVNSPIKQDITVNKAYIPGWKFSINDQEVKPAIIHGLPVLSFEKGVHNIVLEYKNTPVKSQGNIISIMTVLLLGGLLFYGQKNKA